MRIVLDVDGVLADFVGAVLPIINGLSGMNHRPIHVTEWEIEKLLPENLRRAFFHQLEQPGLVKNMQPLRGEVYVARELARRGHEIVIATSPWKSNPHWIRERSEWIAHWLGACEVHHTADKAKVHGDVFVDDKPSHVRHWQANNKGKGYLFDATYNQDSTGLPRIATLRTFL